MKKKKIDSRIEQNKVSDKNIDKLCKYAPVHSSSWIGGTWKINLKRSNSKWECSFPLYLYQ